MHAELRAHFQVDNGVLVSDLVSYEVLGVPVFVFLNMAPDPVFYLWVYS